MASLQRTARLAIGLALLVGCPSPSSAPDPAPKPVDAGRDAGPGLSDGAIVAPEVTRYPDEVPLGNVHATAVRPFAAFTSTLDPGAWIVETLPAGWEVLEIARRGAFVLVTWKPTGRGAHVMGWAPGDDVRPAGGAPLAPASCSDASAPYGAIACARTCWAKTVCPKPTRCVPTEPSGDVVGLCVMPDGRASD